MSSKKYSSYLRLFSAVLIPILAALLQWLLWSKLPGLTWIFFFPAVFLSAWISGLAGGLLATGLAAILGLYFFSPPYAAWAIDDFRHIYSIGIFLAMGTMFSIVFGRLQLATAELQRSNRLIQAQHSELYLLAEAMPHAVWIADAEGLITFINKQWAVFTGTALEQSYGDNWTKHFHPDDRQRAGEAWQDTTKNGVPFNLECRVRRFDGVYRWCSILGKPIRDENNNIVKYIGSCTDIEDFKQAETGLHDAEARWKFALEGSDQGVWDWEISKSKVFFSSRWKSLLGYADDEIGNRFEEWSERLHPDDLQAANQALQQHFRGESPLYKIELRMRSRSGEYLWILARGMVVSRDESGQPLRMIGTHTDITERKKIEQQLLDKEQFLADSQAVAHIGSYQVDLASGQIRWSEETFRLHGLSPETDVPPTIEQLPQLFHPDDRHALQSGMNALLTSNQTPVLEFRPLLSNGETRWLSASAQVERGAGGEPLRIIGTVQNITEQKNAEEQRKHNEAALKEAQKLANIGYWQWELATNTHIWSEEIYHFYGRDPNLPPLVYPEVQQYFTPETWADLVAVVEQAQVDGLPYECDAELVRADGSHGWINARGEAVYDDAGHIIKLRGTLQDITLRKQAEEQLRKFAQAIEQIPESIVITNLHAEIEYINETFIQNTGYSREELIGQNLRILQSGKTPQENFAGLWDMLSQGQSWKGEFYNRRKDASEYIDFAVITPLHQADGRISHYVGVQEDITEKKRLNYELEQYRHHLEELVTSRTTQLETAKAVADIANQSKSVFLANMSHEIRTPMNAVLGFCYLLEQRPLDDDTRSLVSKIHSSGNLLLAIINDILDFSKIEAGRLEIEKVPFRLSDMFDHLAGLMAGTTGNKNLELVIMPLVDADALIGDGQRIQQVLVNLLSNAIKFTDQGEVELRVSIDSENVDQLNLLFAVSDTGIGISSEQQKDVFSAFTQADNTISRRFGGSGLGLAISQQLINLMGGELKVDSIVGQGSKFWFVLPLQRNPEIESTPSQLTDLHLLVADDSSTAREALLQIAHSLGWRADAAESGEAAITRTLAKLGSHSPYDLLLLDWKMPGVDGLTVAQTVHESIPENRRQSEKPPIVLMVTSHSREELLAQPDIDKVDAVLSKPVTPSSLYNAVAKILQQRQPNSLPLATVPIALNGRSIPGVRVLVVDDNDINREVVQRILEAEGATVSLANDGLEALEWLSIHADEVDIVLMDVQMPRMDGYTATHEIRQNLSLAKLPVVALTAGATKDLEGAALAAGMNDFIAKPFNVPNMIALIQRLTACKPAADYQTVGIDVMESMSFEQLRPKHNLAGINFDAGIKVWRQVDVYQTYLSLFISQYRFAGQEIASSSEHGDNAVAAALIHKLKGAAYMLALETVAQLSIDVETALNTGTSIENASAALQSAIEEVSVSLAVWLSSESTVEEKHTDVAILPGEIEKLLTQLLAALDEDSPGNAEQLLITIESLLGPEAIAPIKAQLQSFNFREAEVLTKTLMHDSSCL